MYRFSEATNQNPYQPGIKVAEGVLLPLLNHLFSSSVVAWNEAEGTSLDPTAEYQPHMLTATVPQLTRQPVRYQGNRVNVSPSNEVIAWQQGQSITISFNKARALTGLSFDLGTPNVARHFTLEALVEGKWVEIELFHSADPQATTIHTSNDILGLRACGLRLTNSSTEDLQVFFRSFQFSKQELQ